MQDCRLPEAREAIVRAREIAAEHEGEDDVDWYQGQLDRVDALVAAGEACG